MICYRESGEEKTYKAVVLERIASELTAIESELTTLELERKQASDRVEDIRSSPEAIASAHKSRTLEDEMKKIKSKVTMEELDQHHSRMMLKYYVEDDPDEEKVAEYTLKISNNDCKLAQLRDQVSKLDSLHRESNSRLLNALDAVGNLNKEIKDRKEARKIKMKVIQTLSNPSRRPTSLHPSTIIGEIPNGDWDEAEITKKPCSLCGKGFPKLDVIMGSCGCLYHPWCILTQCWISRIYGNQSYKKEFTEAWMESMGLINIGGK